MWWMVPLAMGALGGIESERKREQQIANNKAEAEIQKYAQWTGRDGQINPNVSSGFMEGALKGAASGAALASNLNSAGMIGEDGSFRWGKPKSGSAGASQVQNPYDLSDDELDSMMRDRMATRAYRSNLIP